MKWAEVTEKIDCRMCHVMPSLIYGPGSSLKISHERFAKGWGTWLHCNYFPESLCFPTCALESWLGKGSLTLIQLGYLERWERRLFGDCLRSGSLLCHFLAMWPWNKYFNLCFLFCKKKRNSSTYPDESREDTVVTSAKCQTIMPVEIVISRISLTHI